MHARHRSPGNGYRSPVGMGLAASRLSPDNSSRGHSFYNSEYRSFNNRGFGRGQAQPRSFQHVPQPLQQKGDILMEAGRLAAEYLASKGLIPHSTFPRKWPNGAVKKQVSDHQDFRLQEDALQFGHAHLGSGASDVVLGRRRYSNDFNSRNHGKGRRGEEHYQRSNSSERIREYGRSESSSDKSMVSPDIEGEDDTFTGNLEKQQAAEETGDRTLKVSGSAPKGDEAANMESGIEYNNLDEMGSKASTSTFEKDGTDKKPSKTSDVVECNLGSEEDTNQNRAADKRIVPNDSIQSCSVESAQSGKRGSDLLSLCSFAKVPTKTRSAVARRVREADQVLNAEGVRTTETGSGPPTVSEVTGQDSTVNFAPTSVALNADHDSKNHYSETSKEVPVQSTFEVGDFSSTIGGVHGKCVRSQSFPDRYFLHNNEEDVSKGVPTFGRSTSVKENGEKRNAEVSNMNDVAKKPREWLPSFIGTVSDHPHLSSFSPSSKNSREEMASSEHPGMVAVHQDTLIDNQQFPKPGTDPCAEYPQEKRLYPSSFKICDLNLMEASDMNDNHCNDQVLLYPSMAACKTEAAQTDIDLSISNSNLSGEFNMCTDNGKNIEVIDLENDSMEEDNKALDDSQRKENYFSGAQGFSSRAENVGDITDAQDNYDGLISEYLFPNCSVAEDINPLQNEIGLDSGEGALGDDDSIYMSLGEIPLSFIPAWEQQPGNEYGKPF